MTQGGLWNRRDSSFAPDTLETARAAAYREGLSLEQWLERTILDRAEATPPRSSPTRRYTPDRAGDDVAAALGEVSRRLNRLLGEVTGPTGREPPRPRAPSAADERAAFERRARTETPNYSLHRRLNEIASSIDSMEPRLPEPPRSRLYGDSRAAPRPADTRAPEADAIAEIHARQRVLDERPAARAPRPEAEPAHASRQDSEALDALRRDIADLVRSVADLAPRHAVETLDASLQALKSRIEDRAPRPIEPAQIDELTRMLIEVRQGVGELRAEDGFAALGNDIKALHHRLDTLDQNRLDPVLLQRLSRQVSELQAAVAKADAPPSADAFVENLHALSGKIDRIAGALDEAAAAVAMMESLERKFDHLSEALSNRPPQEFTGSAMDAEALGDIRDRLERLQSMLENTARNAPAVVEQSILLLVDKLDKIQSMVSGGVHVEEIAARLEEILDRLQRSDDRLDQIAAIERGLGDLFTHIDETHARALEATRSALRELDVGSVDALQRDLSDLRAAHRATDARTHETFETVHGTLERVVDRLATIEDGMARRTAPPMPAPAPETPFNLPHDRIVSSSVVVDPIEDEPPAKVPSAPRAEAEVAPPVAEVEPDLPLEPGTRVPILGGATRDNATAAASAGANSAATAATRQEPNSKAAFIAAARRAAQQANSDAKAQATPGAASESRPGLRAAIARYRTWILAVIVLLAMAAAAPVVLTSSLFGGKPAAVPAAPSAEPTASAPAPTEPPSPPTAIPAAPAIPPASTEPAAPAAPGPQSSLPFGLGSGVPSSGMIGTTPSPFQALVGSRESDENADTTGSVRGKSAAATGAPDGLPAAFPKALRDAALAGDNAALAEVATRYAEGRGVAQSYTEAARWFERAAQAGSALGAYRLANLYEKGQGVAKDVQSARRFYIQSAEAGNIKAMHNLAVLYAEGVDGKPDYRKAAQIFRRAAERGLRDSQYNLAILYARGLGVDTNLGEAFKWLSLAANQGDADAEKKRDDVAARLDAQTLLAARLAVQTFAPQPIDQAANTARASAEWDRGEPARGRRSATRT